MIFQLKLKVEIVERNDKMPRKLKSKAQICEIEQFSQIAFYDCYIIQNVGNALQMFLNKITKFFCGKKSEKENEQRCNLPTFLLQFWVQNHQLRRMRNDERSEKG